MLDEMLDLIIKQAKTEAAEYAANYKITHEIPAYRNNVEVQHFTYLMNRAISKLTEDARAEVTQMSRRS